MVGDILRGEREKQGLTIEDIARETSIRDIYLEAIEREIMIPCLEMYMPRDLLEIIPGFCR